MGFLNEKNGINNEITVLMEEVSKLVSEAQCVNLELVNAEKEVLNEDNDDDSYLLSPEELNLEDK